MSELFKAEFKDAPVNYSEIARYAGAKTVDSELKNLIDVCLKEANELSALNFSLCFTKENIDVSDDTTTLAGFSLKSKNLAKVLKDTKEAVVFASTLGVGIDKLIRKYAEIQPSKALVLQGIGAERIEAYLDYFCEEYKKKNKVTLTMRYSPGYGDLSLESQKQVFALLNPQKYIGVTLNDSLLMSPSKSVTGIIGIGGCDKKEDCSNCNLENCDYRK